MKKIRHRKSCKKRKTVVRNVSVKVKRQRSAVKRKPSLQEKKCKKNSVKNSKSFIVKRKSYKRPQRWSDYIKEDERLRHEKFSTGTLPRIKGIWDQRKYKDLYLSGSFPRRSFSERRNTVTRFHKQLTFYSRLTTFWILAFPGPSLGGQMIFMILITEASPVTDMGGGCQGLTRESTPLCQDIQAPKRFSVTSIGII